MKKYIFSTLFLVSSISIIAQEQSVRSLNKDKELSVVAGMAATKINNSNISGDQYVTLDRKNGAYFSFEYSKFIKNRIGFGIGFGYSNYAQTYYEKGLFSIPNQVDKDGYTYERLIKADVTYSDKLAYINIPVSLHLLLGNSPTFYGFVDAGLINGFLISGKHTEGGSIESMSRYPTDYSNLFIVSQNFPEYGDVYTPIAKQSDDRYKFYNASVHLAVGIAAAMTERLFLKVQPFMDYGLSDIMEPNDKGKEYENVLGEKSPYAATKLFSAGINVGFAFNLN